MADTSFNPLPMSPEQMAQGNVQQIQADANAQGGSAATKVANGTIQNAFQSLVGNPQLAKQNLLQSRLTQASADSEAEATDGESDMDAETRRLRNMYSAVADLDPGTASKIADRLVTLQQAKAEQSRLGVQTQGDMQDNLLKQQNVGTFVVGSSDGTKEFGTVHRFNDDGSPNPDFGKQIAQLQAQNPNSVVANQQQWFANKSAVAAQKAQAQIQIQAMKDEAKAASGAGALDDDTKRLYASESVFNPAALNRQPSDVRTAITKFKADAGITGGDEIGAQVQYRGLQRAAGAVGQRVGNIAILQNEIPAMGKQVLDALDGVTRTDFTPLNSAIAGGKTAFSDPGEKRYGTAIQSFVNSYARLMSGGGSQTTDSARGDAYALLNKADGKAAVQAAIQQLAGRETDIVKNSGDMALEIMANPNKYSAIRKIQSKLGYNVDSGADSSQPQPSGGAAPPATPGVRTYNPATGAFN